MKISKKKNASRHGHSLNKNIFMSALHYAPLLLTLKIFELNFRRQRRLAINIFAFFIAKLNNHCVNFASEPFFMFHNALLTDLLQKQE